MKSRHVVQYIYILICISDLSIRRGVVVRAMMMEEANKWTNKVNIALLIITGGMSGDTCSVLTRCGTTLPLSLLSLSCRNNFLLVSAVAASHPPSTCLLHH